MGKRNKNQYLINGETATLVTNKGQKVLVDTEDIARLKDFTWCVSGNGYVMSRTSGPATILHRFLVCADDGKYVDHINGNPMDNRKVNLRICEKQQNEFNQKIRVDNHTGFRGVCADKRRGGYRGYINKDGRQHHLGQFQRAEDAARAYNEKAVELFGEYARLNVIPQD